MVLPGNFDFDDAILPMFAFATALNFIWELNSDVLNFTNPIEA